MSVAGATDFQIRNEVIMVLENDPAVRNEIQRSLEVQGFPVVDAEGAEEAKDLYSFLEQVIRVVITEPKLPGEKSDSLRSFLGGISPDVEVVFLEDRTSAPPRPRGQNGPLRRSLQKPVDREELLRLVNGLLR